MNLSVLSLIQTFMPLIVLLGIALIGFVAWTSFKRSSIGQLTDALAKELKNGNSTVTEEEIAKTPRSLSGMDALLLPKIARDFPEFSWNEWRDRTEAAVLALAKEKSLDGEAVVYKTVIARYFKEKGTCSILAETNASYLPKPDAPVEENTGEPDGRRSKKAAADGRNTPLRRQSVFETELLYIQDADQVEGKALGINCKNCGAPLKMLGQKSCPYCGAAIEPVNIRVWRIAGIKET